MKTTISILLCKLITWLCHIAKKVGSSYPGSMALKVNNHVLDDIKYPEYVIVVTGSSGKGSSVSYIAHILEQNGKKVIWNKSGSNTTNATTTLVLNNTNAFSHKLNADVLLLELDERYTEVTFKKGIITHLAITNLTRDQPARNIHPKIIYDRVTGAIDDKVHVILNADDPLLNRIRYEFDNKITTFGVAPTKYDKVPEYSVDFAYCPSCSSKLEYKSYHYGHLGVYKCPLCSFSRGKVNYEAKDVDLEKNTFKIGKNEIRLNKSVFFAVYYTTLAYAVCKAIGLDDEDILREINEDKLSSKRGKVHKLNGRKIEMLESKNENSLSYLQSLNYIRDAKGKKTVVMGFENVSRRYRFNDLSWLWDVNFELLNDKSIDKIYCIGRFKYDVATRLDYAGIDKSRIVLVDDLSTLPDKIVKDSTGDIYTMVCFDMTEIITNLLKERDDYEEN